MAKIERWLAKKGDGWLGTDMDGELGERVTKSEHVWL